MNEGQVLRTSISPGKGGYRGGRRQIALCLSGVVAPYRALAWKRLGRAQQRCGRPPVGKI